MIIHEESDNNLFKTKHEPTCNYDDYVGWIECRMV